MRKHDELISTVARAFNLPEGSVRSQHKLLRERGLWTPAPHVGRGRYRPDPRSGDAGNLTMLNLDPEGLSTRCDETVLSLRNSRFSHRGTDPLDRFRMALGGGTEPTLPPFPLFDGFDHRHTFGELLDHLFELWSQSGGLLNQSGHRISTVTLEVRRKGPTVRACLTLDGDVVTYVAAPQPPDQINDKEFEAWLQSVAQMSEGRAVTIRKVDEGILEAIARCVAVDDREVSEPPRKARPRRYRRAAA